MKKGLSVLLIVAALFGFYGGASSLTDVLACKDYWEKEGEKSTADMNKLEDGLNQLGDNEQAYLDGLDQLADGEAQLAEGRATLAKGEADYAAAPGKLAAGRAAIAKGESDLDSLSTLIGGVKAVLKAYPTFREGYEQLKAGRVDAINNPASKKPEMEALVSVLNVYADYGDQNAKKTLQSLGAANAELANQDASQFTNAQYEGFKTYLTKVKAALSDGNDFLNSVKSKMEAIADKNAETTKKIQEAAAELKNAKTQEAKVAALTKLNGFITDANSNVTEADVKTLTLAVNVFMANDPRQASILTALSNAGNWPTVAATDTKETVEAKVTAACTMYGASSGIAGAITSMQSSALKDADDNASLWIGGYNQLQEKRTDTKEGLPYLAGGVAQIIGGVYGSGNKELISGMNKAASAFGFDAHDFTPVATSKLTKDLASGSWMENFYKDGNKIEKAFKAVLPKLTKKYSSGKKELAAGKAEYRQGLADYAAAPGKLADGRKQLADGEKQLEEGKKKLAEYEDGEQQVRDGLATLMSTEPNGGLESILDRRGGDDEFDDANGHLDIQEGLDAVDVGRGYQADSGELITKEITNRAVGTAAGLGAAVLACLAALLSLIKKYKGAAVTAVLAAIAGVAGAVVGNGAGSEFSNIAGSTVGSLPWIAAGVVAAVACVFAIVHFTAKAE
jgi:uncharacterized phage infection (PIP) family protein YhgE